MAYTDINFKTKKQLKEAFASGKTISVFQPGPFGSAVADGSTAIEGPHFPEPHRWYASVEVKDGIVTKIKG